MGDKSPKATGKHASQKQKKDAATQKVKDDVTVAKQVVTTTKK